MKERNVSLCLITQDGKKTIPSSIKIWNYVDEQFYDALTSGDFMTCFYGGCIRVIEVASPNSSGKMKTSSDGRKMIADFEQNAATLHPTGWRLGAYDAQGALVGIYPHYVFKEDGNGSCISDGGITFGYGHWTSQAKYNANPVKRTHCVPMGINK